MTTTINASNSGSGGLIQTADASGVLALQTAGTTAVTVDASQNVGVGTTSPGTYGKFAVAGQSSLGVDQTDYINAVGGGGTARVETVGGNTSINLALSTKGTGSFYIWRGGYGGTNTLLIDGSSNLQFNSGYGSVATAYGCRVWCIYNQSAAIVGSGNVSSITVNTTGDVVLNFATALVDANFSAVATTNESGGAPKWCNTTQPSTVNVRVVTWNANQTKGWFEFNSVAVFR